MGLINSQGFVAVEYKIWALYRVNTLLAVQLAVQLDVLLDVQLAAPRAMQLAAQPAAQPAFQPALGLPSGEETLSTARCAASCAAPIVCTLSIPGIKARVLAAQQLALKLSLNSSRLV